MFSNDKLKFSFLSLFISLLIIYNLNSCKKFMFFLNLDSDVEYVGKESCKKCHEEIYQEFVKSGMGHSFYKPGEQPWIENFQQAIVYDPYSQLNYEPFLFDNQLYIKEFRLKDGKDTLFSNLWKIDWIVGSGRQTRSYIVERNGYLYEAPITWYSQKQIWDLSPGYHEGLNSGFRRPLGEECIHCHNGYSPFSQGTINHFQKISHSIDCERCHGPGQIHVQNMEKDLIVDVGKGQIDYSIVNPKHLDIALQLDICQQCHLQGIVVTQKGKRFQDFRPGLFLKDFFDVFTVEKSNLQEFGIASHAERLKKSACFQKSKNLTCTSCHNAHQPTDLQIALQACFKCHIQPHGKICSLPNTQKENKNCVQCHLHKSGTADIPHVQFTDHYIRIFKEFPQKLNNEQIQNIILFCQTQSPPTSERQARAYWNYYQTRDANSIFLDSIQKYTFNSPSLEAIQYSLHIKNMQKTQELLNNFQPQNLQEKVWKAILQAEYYENQKDYSNAIKFYEQAYQLQPYQISAKLRAILLQIQNSDGSLKTLENALHHVLELYQKNPLDYFVVLNLAKLCNDLRKENEAENYLLQALKIYPNSKEALLELEKLYQRQRNLAQAQKIRERILLTEKVKDKIN